MSTEEIHSIPRSLNPILHPGEYVFCTVSDFQSIPFDQILFIFKEEEGYTIVLPRQIANNLRLEYTYMAAWITLGIITSLDIVGLTARFSTALANGGISCNVVAAYHHDHIFVEYKDGNKALTLLEEVVI